MKSIYLLPGGFNSFVSYTFVYLFFLFYAFFVVFSPFYPLYALILMIPLPYLNDIGDGVNVKLRMTLTPSLCQLSLCQLQHKEPSPVRERFYFFLLYFSFMAVWRRLRQLGQ